MEKNRRGNESESRILAVLALTLGVTATPGCMSEEKEKELISALSETRAQVNAIATSLEEGLEECRASRGDITHLKGLPSEIEWKLDGVKAPSLFIGKTTVKVDKMYAEVNSSLISARSTLGELKRCLDKYPYNTPTSEGPHVVDEQTNNVFVAIKLMANMIEKNLKGIEACREAEASNFGFTNPNLVLEAQFPGSVVDKITFAKEMCAQRIAYNKLTLNELEEMEGKLSGLIALLSESDEFSKPEFEELKERLLGIQTRLQDVIKYLQQNDSEDREGTNNSEDEPRPIRRRPGGTYRIDGNEGRPPVTPPNKRDQIRNIIPRRA